MPKQHRSVQAKRPLQKHRARTRSPTAILHWTIDSKGTVELLDRTLMHRLGLNDLKLKPRQWMRWLTKQTRNLLTHNAKRIQISPYSWSGSVQIHNQSEGSNVLSFVLTPQDVQNRSLEPKARAWTGVGTLTKFGANALQTHVPQECIIEQRERRDDGSVSILCSKHAEVGRFNANLNLICHELKTPLSIILGYVDMLTHEFDTFDRKQIRDDLVKIEHASKHMLSLVTGLLDVSKIAYGTHKVVPEPFCLAELAHELQEEFEVLIRTKRNILVLDLQHSIKPVVQDRLLVKQILSNLLTNALKFTYNGVLQLKIRERLKDRTPWITLSLSDTGVGMSAAEQHSLFRMVPRDRRRSQNESTGIGLMIAKAFVEALGGTLRASSTPRKGSVFIVKIPSRFPQHLQSVSEQNDLSQVATQTHQHAKTVAAEEDASQLLNSDTKVSIQTGKSQQQLQELKGSVSVIATQLNQSFWRKMYKRLAEKATPEAMDQVLVQKSIAQDHKRIDVLYLFEECSPNGLKVAAQLMDQMLGGRPKKSQRVEILHVVPNGDSGWTRIDELMAWCKITQLACQIERMNSFKHVKERLEHNTLDRRLILVDLHSEDASNVHQILSGIERFVGDVALMVVLPGVKQPDSAMNGVTQNAGNAWKNILKEAVLEHYRVHTMQAMPERIQRLKTKLMEL